MVAQKVPPQRQESRSQRLPRIIKYRNFIFITPIGTSRVRANIILIRGEGGNATFVDCGSASDPGNHMLQEVFRKYSVDKAPNVSLLLTHSHADHISNYWWFRNQFSRFQNFASYASAAESHYITFPFSTSPYWFRIHDTLGANPPSKYIRRIGMVFAAPRIFGQVRLYYPITYTFTSNITRLNVRGRKIDPIFTPGHSPGHCAYLDESKILFLGDLVPNTPWLDPAPASLGQMIESVQKLIRLPDRKIDYCVRSHCNSSDHGRFIYPWAEEKTRFEGYRDLIFDTLEKIPTLLRGRVVSTWALGKALLKNVIHYSPLMTRLWVPPGMSWIVGYLGYLEQQGKIRRIQGYNQAAWTS